MTWLIRAALQRPPCCRTPASTMTRGLGQCIHMRALLNRIPSLSLNLAKEHFVGDITFDFSNKVALITGAAGGIGGALATLLARSGTTVVLADLDAQAIETRAASIGEQGGSALPLPLDAGDAESIDRLIGEVRERLGRIDFLIPSAGIYPASEIDQISDEQWRTTQRINLDGVFMLTRRALPLMAEGAAIVNLTSVAGHRGSVGHAHYAASKGGLIAFTRSLAAEVGPRGIRANAVSPGIIDTAMTAEARALNGAEWVASTPLRRNGSAAEVAAVIAFLLSETASFIHGEVVHVNGGLFMAG